MQLHIELGLMQNFVKGMSNNGEPFFYMQKEITNLTDGRFIQGRLQIRTMKDKQLHEVGNGLELATWNSLKVLLRTPLPNYQCQRNHWTKFNCFHTLTLISFVRSINAVKFGFISNTFSIN